VTVPRALLLVLALLQAGGILDLVRRATCEEECRRNGCNDCAPDRDAPQCSCHCPSGATSAPAAIDLVTSAPTTPASKIALDVADQWCASPDPREILHIPRSCAV
jgi:hypothetical protein